MPRKTTAYSKTSGGKAAKRFEVLQRRRMVALLVGAGYQQKEIAEQVGVSAATVCDDVAAIEAGLRVDAQLSLQQKVVREEAALLGDEAMFRALLAEADTPTAQQRAYETVLAIMRRRAEMLGLDASERRKLAEQDGATEGLDELLARVALDADQGQDDAE